MTSLPFGLERTDTYAKLSPGDLEMLGKRACQSYLSGGVSLNDAIVKLAKEHPSISPHQVRRIVEFANQETFAQIFEKQAGDKNVEFDIADPGHILQSLDNGARPSILSSAGSDYCSDPMKTAHSDAEADLHLTKLFMGVDFASPGAEKTSAVLARVGADGHINIISDRILRANMEKSATPMDRILQAGEEGVSGDTGSALSTDMVPDIARMESTEEEEKKAMGGPDAMMPMEPAPGDEGADFSQHPEITHRENMRAMERRVELEKKKQELVAMQAKGMEAQGDMGGAPPPDGGEEGAAPPPDDMAAGPAGGAPMPPEGGMPPEGMPPEGMPPEGGMPPGPPAGAPPGLPGGGPFPMEQMKMSADLTKQAMNYVKMGRAKSREVLDDVKAATSLEKIKAAAAKKEQYPEVNPFGELIRTKQKLACMAGEALAAKDKNDWFQKEALERFDHEVTQYMFNGGNLAEVAHAIDSVSDNAPGIMKVAMGYLIPRLIEKGLDPDKARAQMIPYEMVKGASVRAPNPNNPIVESFATFCKVAHNQKILEQAYVDIEDQYNQVEAVLKLAMRNGTSSK